MQTLLVSFVGGILLLGGAHLARDAEAPGVAFGDPAHGQALFAAKGCVKCHAVRGAGGRIGPDLGRKVIRTSFYEIASVMWNHSQGMSGKMKEYHLARPSFDDEELSDLISFLYFLNYFDDPGNPRLGRTLFTEKHCIRCHRVEGQGGETGPRLDDLPRGMSPLRIAQSLWNHGPEMVAAITEAELEVPQFAGSEILDLFAYVRSQGRREATRRFESPGDPVRGEAVFAAKGCGDCHGMFGDEQGVGPDLGRAELRGSVTQIAGRMWNHWPDMARTMQRAGMQVPQFEGDELLDLFAYMYIARYQGEAGDPARGRLQLEEKGCLVCHGGDVPVGPSLRPLTEGRSEVQIMQAMWNHAPRMGGAMEEQNLSWARLAPAELGDLLAYLSRGWEGAAANE